jgi:hypothetical protein
VPNLAREIVRGNHRTRDPRINLKGILVGNAWTDPAIDNEGAPPAHLAARSFCARAGRCLCACGT